MAVYGSLDMREERKLVCQFKAPPVVSERHAIIEDCYAVLYNSCDNMAADDYRGSRWSKKTGNTRPPLPPPHQGQYYPQANMPQVPQYDQIERPVMTTINYNEARHDHHQKRPVHFNVVEAPAQMKQHGVPTATQVAEKYGGVLITEFPKNHR